MRSANENEVVIIGAGLAGLAAAALVARGHRRVRLLEQSHAPGGRARTKVEQGYYLNIGPHALYRAGRGMEVLGELGVKPSGRVPLASGAFAVKNGRKHTLPQGFVSLLTTSLFGPAAKLETARLLASLSKIDARPIMQMSLAEWVDRNISQADVRELIHALFRVTTYANAPELMSAGAAIEQLKLAVEKSVLYLDGGWQTIVDGLLVAAREAGVEIEIGVKVESVRRDSQGRVDGVRLADGRVINTSTAIVAASPQVAHSLVERAEATGLAAWARDAVAVKAACLDVALKRLPQPKATFALGIDRPLYLSVHSAAARLAPEGGALIQVARYMPPDDSDSPERIERELEALLDLVQAGWREELVYRRFLPDMTVMNAMPEAARGGTAGRPDPEVAGVPGLLVVGDWVGREGLLADASLASARRAAELITGSAPARLAAAG